MVPSFLNTSLNLPSLEMQLHEQMAMLSNHKTLHSIRMSSHKFLGSEKESKAGKDTSSNHAETVDLAKVEHNVTCSIA
jgi:hypothetical protein